MKDTAIQFVVPAEDKGMRLDLYLSANDRLAGVSRSRVGDLIRDSYLFVNGETKKAGYRVKEGDVITGTIPVPKALNLDPEEIAFTILYEDEALAVISKPPGIVVHPACGHQHGTLVHGLLFRCHDLSGINGVERPGIVHRLDRDTSGVMVIAKQDLAHHHLVEQFKGRQIEKRYRALVRGRLSPFSGTINLPIGRHPVQRKKMAVRHDNGREAMTRWQVLEEFSRYTLVEIILLTGRTHQIRVHMAALDHPLAGDQVYGGRTGKDQLPGLNRQFLHSYLLSLHHPVTGESLRFVAPLWPDLEEVLDFLQTKRGMDGKAG